MADQTSSSLFGRSNLFLIGFLVIAALFAAGVWWLLRTDYAPLYKEATEASQAEILATLSQHHVPYKINAQDGVIEVPTEHIASARMYLAESGIPTRAGAGFELFDQADYGMSEFSQKINYQRALEGELARTIMTLSEVQYARVHLTFKKAGLFQGSEEQPKASVIVRLRSDNTLTTQRVRGIQQLVASAVESMAQERVVVLNEQGQVLSSADSAGATPEHLQMAADVEQTLQKKAEQMLQGSLGTQNAQVSVRVQMNFDRVKSVREQPLLPAGKPVIKHEKKLSSKENSTGESTNRRSQDTNETDYEVGREHSEVEHATGKVERISVGIVLSKAMTPEAVISLRTLLQAALGLDEQRGDQLAIMFRPEAAGSNPQPVLDVPKAETAPVLPPLAERPVTQAEEASPYPIGSLRWLAAGFALLLSLLLLGLWVRSKNSRKTTIATLPRLSSVEREQLVVDLRRWMEEGR